ncbi:MAG: potassium transporter Kup [Thermodesulfobacterium geofontis]|uniref:Potassium transporter Kup n=1 Tax=Thermodesulfobacterium geofontis TaxID=1295609 RepID=A0A2N7QB41_9BACT|nr:MAG: potassium transporter Kup [Thermodesulfobacterium geofontis]
MQKNLKNVIKALGIVFGDIGTSPIYTISTIFLFLSVSKENVFGILSLIFWTLILLPTIQYTFLAMKLSLRGEGGILILSEIFKNLVKDKRWKLIATYLGFVGISFLMGDGVITPAISILSAVEGLSLITYIPSITPSTIVYISIIIAIMLFSFQPKGTEKVSITFGPIMLLWFISLSVLGLIYILKVPEVIKAINPWYGIKFLIDHGWKGYLILGIVILCATGAEAMYADIGHLGVKPIKDAWKIVFLALTINYFGQGAYLILHPKTRYVLFEMCKNFSPPLYLPFLILTLLATIIASQAVISAMFSLVYQCILSRYLPVLKVKYTSTELSTQIYIGTVNWFLLLAVCYIMYFFKSSERLAAAYGLAVTGVMVLTGFFLVLIFYFKNLWKFFFLSCLTALISFAYFVSTSHKILEGGYISLIIASIPFLLILLYVKGQERLYKALRPYFLPREEFINKFTKVYTSYPKIPGTALFFIRDLDHIPPYVIETIFFHGILYEENIFISFIRKNEPFGITTGLLEEICPGIKVLEIAYGYMERLNVEDILRENGIEEKVIFYGLEDIEAKNIIWKLYAFIKQISSHYVKFLELPSHKLHGVLTRIEI